MYTQKAMALAKRFNGVLMKPEECDCYLHNQTPLFGLSFKDPKTNFILLDKYDLMNLSPETRKYCLENKVSPFDNLILIIYKDEHSNMNFKLLNGMASVLLAEVILFCNEENSLQKWY